MNTIPASTDHSKISPTAKLVAYLRSLTNIEFSREIAEACQAEEFFKELFGDQHSNIHWLAAMVELRFKSTNALVRYVHPTNVLELASGLSPRGLIMNCLHRFVETDLPDMIMQKLAILPQVTRNPLQELDINHRLVELDATDENQFSEVAAKNFRDGRVMVIHEGLFSYITHEEKKKVTRNIHAILKKHGGFWITPDISSQDRVKELGEIDPFILEVMKKVSELTECNLKGNAFSSTEEAKSFFEELGFSVEIRNQLDCVSQLSALRGKPSNAKFSEVLDKCTLWVMRAK